MLRLAILGAGVGYLAGGAAWLVYALRTAPRLDTDADPFDGDEDDDDGAGEGDADGELGDPVDVAAQRGAAILYARRYAFEERQAGREVDVERAAATALARLGLGAGADLGTDLVRLVTARHPDADN